MFHRTFIALRRPGCLRAGKFAYFLVLKMKNASCKSSTYSQIIFIIPFLCTPVQSFPRLPAITSSATLNNLPPPPTPTPELRPEFLLVRDGGAPYNIQNAPGASDIKVCAGGCLYDLEDYDGGNNDCLNYACVCKNYSSFYSKLELCISASCSDDSSDMLTASSVFSLWCTPAINDGAVTSSFSVSPPVTAPLQYPKCTWSRRPEELC